MKKFLLLAMTMAMGVTASALAADITKTSAANNSQEVVKNITWQDLDFVRVGNYTDNKAKTGVTVLWFPETGTGAVDISGGGPASRETPVIDPMTHDTPLDAVVLAGGSAYGLDAAGGVMACFEDNGIGYETGFAKVPIVVQSDIYDLSYGSAKVRPDKKMGYAACKDALKGTHPISGNVGAGTGATCGKMVSMERAFKTGIGYAALQVGALKVGAVVVVNASGDVHDPYDNMKKIAGFTNEARTEWSDPLFELYQPVLKNKAYDAWGTGDKGNTTIGAIVTNGKFTKAELKKIAEMARGAYLRCISPVGMTCDGDSIYAVSAGKNRIPVDQDAVGVLARVCMEKAILDAARSAKLDDKEYLKNCGKI